MGNILPYLKKLHKPTSKSHKGQNGLALIIAGGKKYHGSAVLAVLSATRFCDLVYFYSPSAKVEFLVRKATPCVICISKKELGAHIKRADVILIGPGMGAEARTRKLVHAVLSSGKKCVLDATALRVLEKKTLHMNCVLTPHIREFEAAFGLKASKKNAIACAKKYKCNILLKGKVDTAAGFDGKFIDVSGGNAGLTKGGTGDTLAGLLCALLCNNEIFVAMCAASYVNKKAGEALAKKFGMNYSALDVANEVSPALFKLLK